MRYAIILAALLPLTATAQEMMTSPSVNFGPGIGSPISGPGVSVSEHLSGPSVTMKGGNTEISQGRTRDGKRWDVQTTEIGDIKVTNGKTPDGGTISCVTTSAGTIC